MQTSFQLASNNRLSADQRASTDGGEFNRGIFQIVIPPLSGEEGSLQTAKKTLPPKKKKIRKPSFTSQSYPSIRLHRVLYFRVA